MPSCPNLLCHLGPADDPFELEEEEEAALLLEKIKILGPCVDSLSVVLNQQDVQPCTDQLMMTSRSCCHLKKLQLDMCADNASSTIEGLFGCTWSFLTSVAIDIAEDFSPTSTDLSDI